MGLRKVLHFPEVTQGELLDEPSATLSSGWLTIRSAHPFRSSKVLINNKAISLDSLNSSESEAEISITDSDLFKVEVAWPPGTPETALFVSVELDGASTFEKTFWAQGILHEEFTPTF